MSAKFIQRTRFTALAAAVLGMAVCVGGADRYPLRSSQAQGMVLAQLSPPPLARWQHVLRHLQGRLQETGVAAGSFPARGGALYTPARRVMLRTNTGAETSRRNRRQEGRPVCDGRLRSIPESESGNSIGNAEILFSCTEESRPSVTTTDTPTTVEATTTTDPLGPELTTEPASNGIDDAICQVNFHDTSTISNGQCPAQKIGFVRMTASVGFAAAVCTEETNSLSGASNTLYMTIQPLCRGAGEAQRWAICSWQPDPSSQICGPLEQNCCNLVTDTPIRDALPDIPTADLSCQEYVSLVDYNALDGQTGVSAMSCNTFYGWNGTAPQIYALELLQCTGGVPADPQCSSPQVVGDVSLSSSNASSSTSGAGPWAIAGVVFGGLFIAVGAALRARRLRRGEVSMQTPQKKKHQFVDWMDRTTANIPLGSNDNDGFTSKPRSKKHRDFMRLYEKLDDNKPKKQSVPEKASLLG